MGKQCQTLFWGGSKITADGDCNHKIKRHLLLGKKAVSNLDSILKSRDITLPTKVCLVKAVVFPVAMYGCESWTIKKAEHWCFWTVVLDKILEGLFDCKEIQPVHPKGNLSWIFTGKTDAKAKTPILWPSDVKNWLLEKTLIWGKIEGRRRRGQQRMRWVDGWHHRRDGHESEQALGVDDGQGSLVCCSPWGHKEVDMTEQLNWTELITESLYCTEEINAAL